jgi:hypothetical protein
MEESQYVGVQSGTDGYTCSFNSGSQTCQASQLQRLPSELLQVVLQCMHSSNWPAVRLVNKQFEASLAPLIKNITIRQWPSSSSSTSTSTSLAVSSSSSLQQVQHLQAVVDSQDDLQQLLHLLPQLPQVQHLTLRGLKPLSGLRTLLKRPKATQLASRGPSSNNNSSSMPPSAAAEALARLTRLELPDSSSSSLPASLQLPGLSSVSLFSVDNIADLAGFAPNIQHLQCFSLNAAPASRPKATPTAAAPPGSNSSSSPLSLASCSTLAATFVTSSSAKAAVARIASAVPALKAIMAVPQLQPLAADAEVLQPQCDEITLQGLQQMLPGLQLVAA